jgi:tRNA(Ile)-lysidine synthase
MVWEQPLFSEEERNIIEKNSQFLPQSGCIRLKEAGKTVQWRIFLKNNAYSAEKKAEIPKKNYTKWFDYDKISHAALFRTRRAGDWFVLDSSGKHKKLKQYFIDEKIPKQERSRIPLLADENHIIWIIGRRISEEYKVRETTRLILELRVID